MSANSQVARNQSRQTFGSVYESTNPITTIAGQHMVEWFTGKSLNTDRWTYLNVTGGGSGAMANSIDGGYAITTTSSNKESNITFNDIRQYSQTGSVTIWVAQSNNTSGTDVHLGLSNDALSASYIATDHQANWELDGSNQYLLTSDGSSASRTPISSGTATGSGFRNGKVECKSTNLQLTVDGVLEVTKTSNRPNAVMQPKFSVYGSTKTASVRYCEAYNT